MRLLIKYKNNLQFIVDFYNDFIFLRLLSDIKK